MYNPNPLGKKRNKHNRSMYTVLEVFDKGDHHSVIMMGQFLGDCLAKPGITSLRQYRIYLYIRKPNNVEFGDNILRDDDMDAWWLVRGPLLKYRLFPDKLPSGIFHKLIGNQ
uniref:Uncharacterized protein n=1 Tax=viral metagenome TaxID=1070528 RepID=A0A6M3IHL1_9ZZZZ